MFHFLEVGEEAVTFAGEVPDAEERADAGAEFEAIDWFGEEVVAAGLDGFFDVSGFIECGDDQYGDHAFGRIIFDLCADFIAAHAGHHDVEKDQIWQVLIDHLHGLLAIGSHENLIAFVGEVGFQQFAILLDIVGDEDAGGGDIDIGVLHVGLSVARQRSVAARDLGER
ncbi:MAG: hypothetical protein RL215_1167 [Planctomycetota bacterium]